MTSISLPKYSGLFYWRHGRQASRRTRHQITVARYCGECSWRTAATMGLSILLAQLKHIAPSPLSLTCSCTFLTPALACLFPLPIQDPQDPLSHRGATLRKTLHTIQRPARPTIAKQRTTINLRRALNILRHPQATCGSAWDETRTAHSH